MTALKTPMMHDDDANERVMDRVERRLSEECGKLRVEMAQMRGELKTEMAEMRGDMRELRGDMRADMSDLRAEMVRGNTALLKWLLVFFVSQTAALAAILRLFVN